MSISSITSKGQVTIPQALREILQLQPGDKIVFEEKDGVITLTPANDNLDNLAGCLTDSTNNKHASLDDIERAIQQGHQQSLLHCKPWTIMRKVSTLQTP